MSFLNVGAPKGYNVHSSGYHFQNCTHRSGDFSRVWHPGREIYSSCDMFVFDIIGMYGSPDVQVRMGLCGNHACDHGCIYLVHCKNHIMAASLFT